MSKNTDKRTITKTIFSVTSVLLIAKLLGFVKQMVVANAFGASIDTDVINLSQGIISNFEYLISQTMLTAFVPIYISVRENEGTEKQFISNVLKIFFVISFFVSAIIFVFAPIVSKILAPSYDVETASYLTSNVRIYAFSLVILVLTAIFNAILKANKHFVPGELISVNQSLSFIVCIFALGSVLGVKVLILSFYVYVIVNAIYLGIVSRKYLSLKRTRIWQDENVKKLLKMMAPLLFSYSLVFINQLIDKMLASGLGEGVVTAMGYGAVLSNFIASFIGSICGIAFTYIAQSVASRLNEKAASIVAYFIIIFVTALIPITIISIINANDIITIVFGRGAFDTEAVKNTTYALMGYGFMFIPFSLRELFTRFQYSYQDSKRPVVYSSISVTCNIVLSIVLSRVWGIFGITLATSISVMICSILNIIGSRRHNKNIKLSRFTKEIILWLIGGVVCLLINILIKDNFVIENTILRFIILAGASLVGYAVMVLPIIIQIIRKRTKKAY